MERGIIMELFSFSVANERERSVNIRCKKIIILIINHGKYITRPLNQKSNCNAPGLGGCVVILFSPSLYWLITLIPIHTRNERNSRTIEYDKPLNFRNSPGHQFLCDLNNISWRARRLLRKSRAKASITMIMCNFSEMCYMRQKQWSRVNWADLDTKVNVIGLLR